RADRPAHVDARPLRARGSLAASSADAHRSRQLLGEEVDLVLRTGGALDVVEALRLFKRLAQVRQAALVGRACGRVEHLARVAAGHAGAGISRLLAGHE